MLIYWTGRDHGIHYYQARLRIFLEFFIVNVFVLVFISLRKNLTYKFLGIFGVTKPNLKILRRCLMKPSFPYDNFFSNIAFFLEVYATDQF